MQIPFTGKLIDERFLMHRLKSTSTAGIVCAITSVLLFEYRHFVNHIWSWDLLAIGLTFVVVKVAVLLWYRLTD